MRIAIIDDIASERKLLHERLDVLLPGMTLDACIFEYENGNLFLAAARQERFDLIFLDIYMEPDNGVEVAGRLREFDTDCLLVFTTTSLDHALEGFRVRAMHYLVKPYSDAELATLFEEILKRLPSQERYIDVHAAGGMVRLRYKEILYAEHYRHQIHIYATGGRDIVTRQTFREFTGSLSDSRFFLCSRGALVNMEHAADFNGAEFVLSDGKKMAVSRDLIKAARSAFGDFLFERRS